jgi:Peptidase M50B-like
VTHLLVSNTFGRIGEIQIPLPAPVALFIGILVFIAVLGSTLWKIATHAVTVVHEAAHATVGLVAGRNIRNVKINPNGGGSTVMVPQTGFGYGVAAFAGYIGPSAAGLLAAWLISIGRIVAVLWLGGLMLAVMVLMVRNFFGGIVILACGALLYVILRYSPAGVETAAAYGVTWFLLLSAPKDALSAATQPKNVADAKALAGMTVLWPSAWCFLWVVGTIAALVVGGAILVT